MCGGLFAATLLRIPGNPSSIATTFDGYPLAQKGYPVKALATGIWANFVGGIVGLAALIGFAPVIARFALSFGPFEMTMLTVMAMTVVISLSHGSMVKGLLAALVGMACGLVGFAPIDGAARYTFGNVNLTRRLRRGAGDRRAVRDRADRARGSPRRAGGEDRPGTKGGRHQ